MIKTGTVSPPNRRVEHGSPASNWPPERGRGTVDKKSKKKSGAEDRGTFNKKPKANGNKREKLKRKKNGHADLRCDPRSKRGY